MVKLSCVLSINTVAYEAERRKRVLIKGILKQNIEQGLIPAHEERQRWEKINNIPNHVIRVHLKVMSDVSR